MNLLFDFFLKRPAKKVKPVAALAGPPKLGRPAHLVRGQRQRKEQYKAMVEELTERYKIRVRRWRKNSSGVAWITEGRDSTQQRWLEAPFPAGPVSCAIFLHEVGHHAIGFNTYKPRCLEELRAWQWALREMEVRKLNISDAVRKRVHDSMRYAVSKAMRRGLKRLPIELKPYL